jgi:hypothetical protein
MNTPQTLTDTATGAVRIQAHYSRERRLGHWTSARSFDIQARRGLVVLDLRSAQIPEGDIEIHLDADRSALKLYVPEDAVVDHWNLRIVGRGRVKNYQEPEAATGRRIVIHGELRRGEIRVRRGGVAIISAMLTREYVDDVRRANRDGILPTVDDPTRAAPGTPYTS